ncbi:PilZ domain-containing protein [Thermodesulfobacteriota bacterium]
MVPSDQENEKYDIIGRVIEQLYDMPVDELKILSKSLAENDLNLQGTQYERQHDRKKCVITVDYATASRAFKDYIQDISNSGVFITTAEPFKLGDEVVLVISFTGDQNPFKIPAQIVRQTDDGIGLRFNFQSQVQEAIINSFVQEVKGR